MDSYDKAEYVRGKLGARRVFRKLGHYAAIAAFVAGTAYVASRFDFSKRVDAYYSKHCKPGIERLVGK